MYTPFVKQTANKDITFILFLLLLQFYNAIMMIFMSSSSQLLWHWHNYELIVKYAFTTVGMPQGSLYYILYENLRNILTLWELSKRLKFERFPRKDQTEKCNGWKFCHISIFSTKNILMHL